MREELAQLYEDTEQIIKLCHAQRINLQTQQALLKLQQEKLLLEVERLKKLNQTILAPFYQRGVFRRSNS